MAMSEKQLRSWYSRWSSRHSEIRQILNSARANAAKHDQPLSLGMMDTLRIMELMARL